MSVSIRWRVFASALLALSALTLISRPAADAAGQVVAPDEVLGIVVEPTPTPAARPAWGPIGRSLPVPDALLRWTVPVRRTATTPDSILGRSLVASPTVPAIDAPPTPIATLAPTPPAALTAGAVTVESPATTTRPGPVVAPPDPVERPQPLSVEQRGQQALARVGFDLSSLGYTISFHSHTGGYRGLTFADRRHITVYLKPTDSEAAVAYAVAHEVGHAVDHIRNSDADRAAWRQARGINPAAPWWPTAATNDFATPAGDFAECYASWRVGSASHSSWGGCAGMGSLIAAMILPG